MYGVDSGAGKRRRTERQCLLQKRSLIPQEMDVTKEQLSLGPHCVVLSFSYGGRTAVATMLTNCSEGGRAGGREGGREPGSQGARSQGAREGQTDGRTDRRMDGQTE